MTGAHSDLGDFDILDPEVQQCPHLYYAAMRESCPVFLAEAAGTEFYLISRHEDVMRVLMDPGTFSSKFGRSGLPPSKEAVKRLIEVQEEYGAYPRRDTLLTVDPPEHTRYRKLVSRAFTSRAIADLEPFIRSRTNELIDRFLPTGRCEFVEEFAVPLPVAVIARALNVPGDRLKDFKRWSDDAIAGTGRELTVDEQVECEKSIIEFQHYFAEQLDQRRAEPREDILTNLVQARIDIQEDPDLPDEPLSTEEILSILQQILVAGNETTTKLLAEAMLLLSERPEVWNQLQTDPTMAGRVAEESLRLSSPTQGMWRIATRDVDVAGTSIPAGSRVVIMYASANRDETLFPDGDSFEPNRDNLSQHLSFGKGNHFCLGASLSRLETTVALEELSRRIHSFSLSSGNEIRYQPSFMLRGLKRLDLELTTS